MTNDTNQKLEQIVNDAMSRQLRGEVMSAVGSLYESIQHYTEVTGKRFRMTKAQKAKNMSREDAFQEFLKIHAK